MDALADLFAAAREAQKQAHAPYSDFPVGAAVLTPSGRIHVGCNVENASYPVGTCAEAGAIASMIVAGEKRITDLLVIGPRQPIVPCGACRQRIQEFADPATRIHCAGPDAIAATYRMSDLLPHAFGPEAVLEAAGRK
jgi:cytidine deaminase